MARRVCWSRRGIPHMPSGNPSRISACRRRELPSACMDEMIRRLRGSHTGVQLDARGVGGTEDRLGAGHFVGGAVRHHQKAVGFYGGLVLDHAVLGYSIGVPKDSVIQYETAVKADSF